MWNEMKHTQKKARISLQCVQSNTNQWCSFELVKLEQVCFYTEDFVWEFPLQNFIWSEVSANLLEESQTSGRQRTYDRKREWNGYS